MEGGRGDKAGQITYFSFAWIEAFQHNDWAVGRTPFLACQTVWVFINNECHSVTKTARRFSPLYNQFPPDSLICILLARLGELEKEYIKTSNEGLIVPLQR